MRRQLEKNMMYIKLQKVEGDNGDVKKVPPENTTEEDKVIETQDAIEKEKEAGTMSEMQLVQEKQTTVKKSGRLPTTSKAENEVRNAGEVTSVPLEQRFLSFSDHSTPCCHVQSSTPK
ncbi:hypothetical protein E2C01_014571 [Portunus trituberculatus]|uniref:Uncharacterized protein n=1 Tax=Portunus trituberculatus TaxID=210409 RepID=A0A5B7DKD6_PORTR|nr:hypothetical protein [Portunus trituberculatus]